ncbi:hypothetical protein Y032_0153g2914 [Ancylostoma ceylanicum]|uniref:Uncharacterized protein n=1 Tax=Ancylostoma ceylanicum TaxID=53326 RepID=A0A016SZH1_9BILA|nr:hypothetical protein Y032_0153g2914 [Ancylostoma ceylanicum]
MSDSRHKDTKRKTDNRCAPMTAITQQPKLDAEMLLFIKVRHLIWRFVKRNLWLQTAPEPETNFRRGIVWNFHRENREMSDCHRTSTV